MVSVKGLKHRNYSIKLCSKHRINWEMTWTLTLACLRYTPGKKTTFEILILTYSNIELTKSNKLAEFKELHGKLWQVLLTLCVPLCAIRKCPHMIILRWFIKRVLLTLSFEPLFWYRHDVSITDWSRFDQQLSEKTEMSSIQSNEASRFRFSVKYLKLTVVLQIVCLVPVPLAPKLIYFLHVNKSIALNEF